MTKGITNAFNKLSYIVVELEAEAGKGFITPVFEDTLNLERLENTVDDEEPVQGRLIYWSPPDPVNADHKPLDRKILCSLHPNLDKNKLEDPYHITN